MIRQFSVMLETRCVCETQMPPIIADTEDAMVIWTNTLIPVQKSRHKKYSGARLKARICEIAKP